MPFARRRSRPTTGGGVAGKTVVDRDAPSLPRVSVDAGTVMKGTLEKLGLHLSPSGENIVAPVLTDEPDEMMAADLVSPPASVDTHSATGVGVAETEEQHDVALAVTSPPTAAASADTHPPRLSFQFRNASESRLSSHLPKSVLPSHRETTAPLTTSTITTTTTSASEAAPPAAAPPSIITTAPPRPSHDEIRKKGSMQALFSRANSTLRRDSGFRHSFVRQSIPRSADEKRRGHVHSGSTPDLPLVDRTEPVAANSSLGGQSAAPPPSRLAPPAYGDEAGSQLAIPVDRLSDSSRSDGSEHRVYAQTTTTHTISTTTTFFKLKRNKKPKGSLFPLLDNIPPPSDRPSLSRSPPDSTRAAAAMSPKSMSPSRKSANVRFDPDAATPPVFDHSPSESAPALTSAPKESDQSGYSTPSGVLIPPRLGNRGRTSTISSFAPSAERLADGMPQQVPASGRTSTSTTGRRSFGDLLTLPHRLRQNSNPSARQSATSIPGTPASMPNSVSLAREQEQATQVAYPKREDDETPASYLERLEAAVPRSSIATILCKTGDDFSKTCLRKYMRGFSYFGESVDMAIRKMLMEVELPKETQQIDRLLTGFADRYYECNPGIFTSTEETAFVAFSILLLHSDTHNKNNKRKMTKQDYFKNTQQGPAQVSADILACFYDNICYTPFIHFEDEVAINSHRRSIPRAKKSLIRSKSSEKLRGPVDPYILILDNRLDTLRPSLKDVMDTEDTYKRCGTAPGFDCHALHLAFAKSAVLQIVSARSRPDAFKHQNTIANPAEAQAGLVSFKVAKVGLLWRKDPKKKKAQRTWQEWGAILTDSKLYFFKDVGWTKRLMSQCDNHARALTRSTLVFKPPLQSFSADAWMNMDDSVALMDTGYKRHKNAFTFIKHGGFEEIFLANSEADMNDWIGKLNYAATFRTAGLRMRGAAGAVTAALHDTGKRPRKNSDMSTLSADTPATKDGGGSGSSPIQLSAPRATNPQSEWEIAYYRRQLIGEKISDLDEKIAATQKELDHLLRNARHLLVLLPIQVKTREDVILAAGRMSAKLKWTRVELWRAKTHQEILSKDLEHESPSDFPAPAAASRLTSPTAKSTPVKSPQQSLNRTNTDTSHRPLSLVSSISPITSRQAASAAIDRLVQSTTSSQNPSAANSPTVSNAGIDHETESPALLLHPTPTTAAADRHSQVIVDDDDEDRDDDAAAPSPDSTPPKDNHAPAGGESEQHRNDRSSDVAGNVRRSLHRTLRDSHGSFHASHHHSSSFHRHKKGKSSVGSSLNDESLKAGMSDASSNELRRGAGSFILHGKKASVITMGTEWPAISQEERRRRRIDETEDEAAKAGGDEGQEAGEARGAWAQRASICSLTTVVTTTEEEFVDAISLNDDDDDDDDDDDIVGARAGHPRRGSSMRMSRMSQMSSHYSSAQSSPFLFGPSDGFFHPHDAVVASGGSDGEADDDAKAATGKAERLESDE